MIHRDIRQSQTLPAEFYKSQLYFTHLRELAFRPAWNYLGLFENEAHNAVPFTLLPGYLDEPLLLTKDRTGQVHSMSNVCTHRANLVVDSAGTYPILRCRYHGRCFGLEGAFRSMPGFDDVADFPSDSDSLPQISSSSIGPMVFGQLGTGKSFDQQFGEMLDEMSFYNFDDLSFRPNASRDYSVKAHWALYVDNYLEGFHVPYVHPDLNDALDVDEYTVELKKNAVLQIGIADDQENAVLSIPADHRLGSQRVFAMYWWIFPNMMFNFYPWGISVNIVEPISMEETRIRFLTFAFSDLQDPDISGIHQTEIEDEEVVESVQKGLKSTLYDRGRFSPKYERAVHHFHTMLSTLLHVS